MATGTVRQIIEFKGQDDTTAVANKVKKSVEGIADAADKTSKATSKINGKGLEEIQQKSGDVESALKGISDFAGDAKGQVSQLGDSFGAVEGIMRLLPGPIGLATTAIAGLAIGGKLLSDYISQSAAKARLLTSGLGSSLADSLNLGADGAVKLSAALADLGDKSLRPSELLLKQVADNARALGQDPADNVAKFIAAWKQGPDAVAKVEQEIGKIGTAMRTLSETAAGLGLDVVALGFQKAVTPAEELNTALTDTALLAKEISGLEETRATFQRKASEDAVANLITFQDTFDALTKEINSRQKSLEFRERDAKAAAATIEAQQTVNELEASRTRTAQIANIQASLAGDKQAVQKQRLTALGNAQTEVERSISLILAAQSVLGEKFAQSKVEALNLTKLQLDAQVKQIKDAEAAEKRAAAAAGAARARAAREAKLRDMAKFASEEIADLAAMEATSKQQANEAVRANVKALEDQAAAQQRLVEARIGGTEDPAVKARLEIANIEAQRDRDLIAARKEDGITEIARLAKLQAITIESTTKTVAIQTAADAKIKESAEKVAAAQRDSADAALSIVGAAAQAAQAYAGPNGLAGAIGQAVTSTQTLLKGWSTTESNTSGVIGAIGAVTASVVDGEKTKAAILGVMELALVAASFPDPAKMAAHGAAAVIYGGIAGGLFGGGASGAAPGAAPGGLTTTTGTTAQGQQQGAGSTTVINFVAPLATRYEIGKSVVEAQKAAKAYASASPGV